MPLSTGQSYFWNVANTNTKTDTYADLYLITTAPNAQPSISILDGSAQFEQYVPGSPFSAPITDATNYGAWLVGDYNGDGIADLFGIKVNNTGDWIQVCVLDGSNNFQSFLLPLTNTPISASDAANYRWALGIYGGNQTPSLWEIQVSNTQTQTVEAHALDGSNHLGSYLLQAYTPIKTVFNVYVGWMMADYQGDGFQDLFGINVGPITTSGKVEVMIVNGAYQS